MAVTSCRPNRPGHRNIPSGGHCGEEWSRRKSKKRNYSGLWMVAPLSKIRTSKRIALLRYRLFLRVQPRWTGTPGEKAHPRHLSLSPLSPPSLSAEPTRLTTKVRLPLPFELHLCALHRRHITALGLSLPAAVRTRVQAPPAEGRRATQRRIRCLGLSILGCELWVCRFG